MKVRRLLRRILLIGIGVTIAGVIAYALAFPAIAVLVCAPCYGMSYASSRMVVDNAASAAQRRALDNAIASANVTVRNFYGTTGRKPYVVVCATRACDGRMGGTGVNALTITGPFFTVVRVSSNGIDPSFLAHEFAHVEFHDRVGLANLQRNVPAWFDEGLAVIVSGDRRSIRPGSTPAQRCRGSATSRLPSDADEWTRLAMQDPRIYADAACRTLHWMERHGGRSGTLAVIGQLSRGGLLPE